MGIATGIGSIIVIGLTLGMCPKISEIQTTVEAKMEHDEIERRVSQAAQVQHGRIDAVVARHRQLIDQQRVELKEYRKELRSDRAASMDLQRELLEAINRRR